MSDPADLSAAELLERYARGRLSPVEATEATLARISERDGAVNAFVLVDADAARRAARASDARWRRGAPCGRLDGVPATVKDLNRVAGWPLRQGSLTTCEAPCAQDESYVARLRAHGAVFLGKTTTPEFGWKGVTDSPLTGITRNPWDARLTPGGSSGGAAAAAALGMGALHVGGDGGGSIRIPCGFSGVFGIKPSFGRVPKYPQTSPVALTQAGPITRTVTDAALMLGVMSEPDPRDWLALPPGGDPLEGLEVGVAGLRIGVVPETGAARVNPEIAAAVAGAAETFAALGATLRTLAADALPDAAETFTAHWRAAQALRVADVAPGLRGRLDPGLLACARAGEAMSAVELARAARERVTLGEAVTGLFLDHDLLLTPALPVTAFEGGVEVPPGGPYRGWIDWTPFTYPFNLAGNPAAVCPCGFTAAGLPVGLQLVGPPRGEAQVLRAARAFERARPFRMPGRAPAGDRAATAG